MAEQTDYRPSPEDIEKLQSSIQTLTERGAVRGEARHLLEVIGKENWGLPKDNIDVSKRVLRGFMSRPYIFGEDVEDLMSALDQEEKFAYTDWAKRKDALRERVTKVKGAAIRLAFIAIGAAGIYIGANHYAAWNAVYNSPDAVAQRQVEAQQKEEEKRLKQEAEEQKQILGLIPSKITSSGWRVKYAPIDSSVGYREIKQADRKKY